jgi:uncharacterized membrane protein YraQ (UPF0718 family)
MGYIIDFFYEFWNILELVSLYLILGLILAGIIKVYMPSDFVKKHIGKDGFGSVFKATLIGIPLPMCSCSVIPFATSLKKSGASRGAVTSFFISTPMTGVDSIIATAGVFGYVVASFRVVSSIISAFIAGMLIQSIKDIPKEDFTGSSHSHSHSHSHSECGCDSHCCSTKPKSKLNQIFDYAFNDLFADIAKPIFIGVIFATIVTMVIPDDFKEFANANNYLGYLIAIAVGLPLYVCSISAIPIAIMLLSSGFSFGVAFMFLSVAPATNMITMSVFKKLFGLKALVIYSVVIVVVSTISAIILDTFFVIDSISSFSENETLGSLYTIGALVYLILTFVYFFKKRS